MFKALLKSRCEGSLYEWDRSAGDYRESFEWTGSKGDESLERKLWPYKNG